MRTSGLNGNGATPTFDSGECRRSSNELEHVALGNRPFSPIVSVRAQCADVHCGRPEQQQAPRPQCGRGDTRQLVNCNPERGDEQHRGDVHVAGTCGGLDAQPRTFDAESDVDQDRRDCE